MNTTGRTTIVWLLILIVIAALVFYFGLQTGKSAPSQVSTATSTAAVPGSAYYENTAQWQTYTDAFAGYSIAYPIDFSVNEPNSIAPTTDWLMNNVDQTPGIQTFTLTIPAAFEPQTNFVDATLTVGYSENDSALSDCLVAQNGEATSTTQTVNNATFTVFTMSNPGAGNVYDTTSYRTTHAGACYAVEYTIHSAELGNFPPSYGLQQFNEAAVSTLMDRIVGTFTFH